MVIELKFLIAVQVGMAGAPGAARIHNLRRLLWPHGGDHDPRHLQEAAPDGSEVRSGEPLHDLLLLLRNGGDGTFFDSLQVQLVEIGRFQEGRHFQAPHFKSGAPAESLTTRAG